MVEKIVCLDNTNMDVYAVGISTLVATLVTLYTLYSDRKDAQKSKRQYAIVFCTVLIITYMLYVLCTDTNENNQMFDNMKGGEPPF
jgi:NADH:ubiquinone oxidoreductase subunit 6 (subunit J)